MQGIFTNRYLIFSVLIQRFPAEVKDIQIKIENIYSVKHSFSFREHQTLIISPATDGTIQIMMTVVTRVQMSTGLSLIILRCRGRELHLWSGEHRLQGDQGRVRGPRAGHEEDLHLQALLRPRGLAAQSPRAGNLQERVQGFQRNIFTL